MDGLVALDLGKMVIEVPRSTDNKVQSNHTSHQGIGAVPKSKTKTQHVTRRQKVDQLRQVDHVSTNTHILVEVSLSCTCLKTLKLSPSTVLFLDVSIGSCLSRCR